MKFRLTRTSESYDQSKKPQYVEIKTIKDLMALVEKEGELIISNRGHDWDIKAKKFANHEPAIEIYDSYRE